MAAFAVEFVYGHLKRISTLLKRPRRAIAVASRWGRKGATCISMYSHCCRLQNIFCHRLAPACWLEVVQAECGWMIEWSRVALSTDAFSRRRVEAWRRLLRKAPPSPAHAKPALRRSLGLRTTTTPLRAHRPSKLTFAPRQQHSLRQNDCRRNSQKRRRPRPWRLNTCWT